MIALACCRCSIAWAISGEYARCEIRASLARTPALASRSESCCIDRKSTRLNSSHEWISTLSPSAPLSVPLHRRRADLGKIREVRDPPLAGKTAGFGEPLRELLH